MELNELYVESLFCALYMTTSICGTLVTCKHRFCGGVCHASHKN